MKIYTGETPMQELKGNLQAELIKMGKAAALELKCPAENLKWRINNAGMVEWQQMNNAELAEMQAQEAKQKRVIDVKKKRGVLDA